MACAPGWLEASRELLVELLATVTKLALLFGPGFKGLLTTGLCVEQQRRGISIGLASSVSTSRPATQTRSRKATQTRTVRYKTEEKM